MSSQAPAFFASRAKFRAWLQKNHAKASELWVGFYKKASGRGGLTYPEALDEALCFGWIDGVRKRAGDDAYVQRFTPRTSKSYWSAVNVARATRLIKEELMARPGLEAFERRDREVTARYSFERDSSRFTHAELKLFRAKRDAWEFFDAQPPYYKRVATFFVTSAKKPETRSRRLAQLIDLSAARQRLGIMTSSAKNRPEP